MIFYLEVSAEGFKGPSGTFDWVVTGAVVSNFKIFATVKQETKASVTPQNVIIAAKCNINAKCNKNRRKM